MPTTRFTAENWPESAIEFRRILQEAWHGSAPIDDFVQLVRDLTLLEQKHGLSSTEFYNRYQRGEMGDEMEIMRWASKFEIYEEMKEDLDYDNAPHYPDLPGFPEHKHDGEQVLSAPAPDLSQVLRETDRYLYPDTATDQEAE